MIPYFSRIPIAVGLLAAFLLTTGAARAADFFSGPARTQAQERVDELAAIQARNEDAVLAQPGVFAIGIGLHEGELVFEAWYDEIAPPPQLPPALEGVPLLVWPDTRPTPANGGAACQPCHANQLALPVQMGNSGKDTASCSACTMGFKACDLQSGDAVWVTNAHCSTDATTCPGSAAIGAATQHVSPLDAPTCSTATSAVGTVQGHAPPVCGVNSTVDATIVDSDNTLTQWSIRDIGTPSATPGVALPGDEVQKSGRTTGLTTGIVDAINVTINVTYNCCTSAITMAQQIRVNATGAIFCNGGDSGSGLLNFAQPAAELVGLVFARNATGTTCWANTIANVTGALNLSLNQLDCLTIECPAESAAASSADPTGNLDLLYQLRDDVLLQIELGVEKVERFYAVAPDWASLYLWNPGLLLQATEGLDTYRFVLEGVVKGDPVSVTPQQIDDVAQILADHALAAGPGPLRQAFLDWRQDVQDPAVQAVFGIAVAPACQSGNPSDWDCDGIPNGSDICPFYAQASNTDTDANGIGDECECGDQGGPTGSGPGHQDGRVNLHDVFAINAAILDPGLATPLCDTNEDGQCNLLDIFGANAKILGQPAWCSRYPQT